MSDRSLRSDAVARLARGEPTVVVEIVRSRGSVPREPGTRMLVDRDAIEGTIGGGNLEWRATANARRMLTDASYRPDDENIALGTSLGQCCGGAVTLRYRMLDAASLAAWRSTAPVPTIQVYGAGHVGRAVVQVLGLLDVEVQWIDEREAAFPAEPSAANVRRVCVDAVEAEVAVAPPDCFHLVLTHQHDLDLRIVEAILRRDDFAFLGLIGSTTKRRRFAQLLRDRGIADDVVARMTCPIGIPDIAGKEPAHIAIAVAAQLLPMIEAAVTRNAENDRMSAG
jgi:xanthine dehydrogenase accessory factor